MDILVISSYPAKGSIHGKETVGVASYTKNTLLHLQKISPEFRFRVLAEILEKPETYEENGIQIKRIWRRNNILSLFHIAKEIVRTNAKILIPFEVYMFGNVFYAGLFLSIISILRLAGKRYIMILHQVPEDISAAEKNTMRSRLFPHVKNILYGALRRAAQHIIVFEEAFKKRLGDAPHIHVIPHAVETLPAIDKKKARNQLGLDENAKYLLYFGFISPYKGIDTLIDIWPAETNWKLIIAGGSNPNYYNDSNYQQYIQLVNQKATQKKAILTGYLQESDIPLYFAASDAVVLPYNVFFSSSGPLSLAFAAEQPVLLSQALADYCQTADIKESLEEAHLTKEQILFHFQPKDLIQKLTQIDINTADYVAFSASMKNRRRWSTLAREYAKLLTLT